MHSYEQLFLKGCYTYCYTRWSRVRFLLSFQRVEALALDSSPMSSANTRTSECSSFCIGERIGTRTKFDNPRQHDKGLTGSSYDIIRNKKVENS